MKRYIGLLYCVLIFVGCQDILPKNKLMSSSSMTETIPEGSKFALSPIIEVQTGSIVAFLQNSKETDFTNSMWVSRVIARSGDKLEIQNGRILINDRLVKNPPKAKFGYFIESQMINETLLNERKGSPVRKYKEGEFFAFLTNESLQSLKSEFPSATFHSIRDNPNLHYPAEGHELNKWTIDAFGPIEIPEVGDTVLLNKRNKALFSRYNEFPVGTPIIITEEMFFLMGDNRHNAIDSRIIGYVPRSAVLGEVVFEME